MQTLPAPPLPAPTPSAAPLRSRPPARRTALAELDHLWQRGPAGQVLLLVSAASVAATFVLLALGLLSLAA
ncbi:hypothetical protein KSP35_01230 [Aquihabitans sp. G128]|uniref:hypothetical protein n=1 Tax=Aquihabitans sp. G128 TaxID=2849779 RepID=UPI001C216692|nr:hypothetical protein [Aquihabitans sp. G128]QXC61502.1 hypothetical protein KSP35_01230 [Aquihabitans sp. G128]